MKRNLDGVHPDEQRRGVEARDEEIPKEDGEGVTRENNEEESSELDQHYHMLALNFLKSVLVLPGLDITPRNRFHLLGRLTGDESLAHSKKIIYPSSNDNYIDQAYREDGHMSFMTNEPLLIPVPTTDTLHQPSKTYHALRPSPPSKS